eukprot:scaffold12644_cov60-Phaeocystis_antarctica.AAC.1
MMGPPRHPNCHHTYPKTESVRYSLAFSHNSYAYPLILLVLYVRATRTSLLRAARTRGTGQLAPKTHALTQGPTHCTCAVRVPASGVPYAPRTVWCTSGGPHRLRRLLPWHTCAAAAHGRRAPNLNSSPSP